MSTNVQRLHHVGIVAQDRAASVAWYCEYLGFEHQYDFALPEAKATMLVLGDARLEIYQVEGAAAATADRQEVETILKVGGINHLALWVEELDDFVASLERKGVDVVVPPTAVPNDSGDRFAFIRDSERMLIELFEPAR